MKTLQILLVIVLCSAPVYADQALVLTEIEQIQEKIWYLQRDIATQKTSLAEHQKQLNLLTTKADNDQVKLNESLAALVQSTANQQGEVTQVEISLQELQETLTTLTEEIEQQSSTIVRQTGKIGALENSLQTLRTEFAENQASTEQALAEASQLLLDTRSQIDTQNQDTDIRVKQISLLGGGVVLVLLIILTIGLIFRRSRKKKTGSERKPSTKHEM